MKRSTHGMHAFGAPTQNTGYNSNRVQQLVSEESTIFISIHLILDF